MGSPFPSPPQDKHFEVNFVDDTVETVKGELPADICYPLLSREKNGEIKILEVGRWWTVTLLTLDAETRSKLVSHGRIHINMDNVTFIKEC